MPYILPLQGTFYVPPEHQPVVSRIAPTSGDFARGVRDDSLTFPVGVAITRPLDELDA